MDPIVLLMLLLVLMSIKIKGFFDHQYIRTSTKGKQSVLDFLVRDSNQRKGAYKIATAVCVWLREFSLPQTSLDLPWLGFGASGSDKTTLEVLQNERLNED